MTKDDYPGPRASLFMGFVGAIFALGLIFGIRSCVTPVTCMDCLQRCRPLDVKSCNLHRQEGEWKPDCVCIDKLEEP